MSSQALARWIPCTSRADLVGEREGHSSVILRCPAPTDAPAALLQDVVVVFGGFVQGGTSDELLVARPSVSPRSGVNDGGPSLDVALDWRVALTNAELCCREGFAIARHPTQPNLGVVFGGLNDDIEVINDLWAVVAEPNTEQPDGCDVSGTKVEAAGEPPTPRSRHAMASTDTSIFVFGGDAGDGTLLADVHRLDPVQLVWQKVACTPSVPPRFLPFFTAWASPDDVHGREGFHETLYVWGGAENDANGELRSLSSAFVGRLSHADNSLTISWEPMAASSPVLPTPANGGSAALLSSGEGRRRIVFCGGKDRATGNDDLVVLTLTASGEVESHKRWCVPYDGDGADNDDARSIGEHQWPHWRYLSSVAVIGEGTSHQLLLHIGGNCRHPDATAVYAHGV